MDMFVPWREVLINLLTISLKSYIPHLRKSMKHSFRNSNTCWLGRMIATPILRLEGLGTFKQVISLDTKNWDKYQIKVQVHLDADHSNNKKRFHQQKELRISIQNFSEMRTANERHSNDKYLIQIHPAKMGIFPQIGMNISK